MTLRRWAVYSVGTKATPGWHRRFWTRKAAMRAAHRLNEANTFPVGELAYYWDGWERSEETPPGEER